jgi:hypothetical protein
MRETVSVLDYNENANDGVTIASDAIDAALAAGNNIYFPAGTYRINRPIKLTSGKSIHGDYNKTIIHAASVVGAAIEVINPLGGQNFYYNANIVGFAIRGSANQAVYVNRGICCVIDYIFADGIVCSDSVFRFEMCFGSSITNLWGIGTSTAPIGYLCGQAFNANTCFNWYLSINGLQRGIVLNEQLDGGTSPAHGSIFTNMCIQSCVLGVDIMSYNSAFMQLYFEDVANHMKFGDTASNGIARGIVVSGTDFAAAYPGGLNANAVECVFNVEHAIGCTISGGDFGAIQNSGLSAPVTVDDLDGTGCIVLTTVDKNGKIIAAYPIIEGSGYTAPSLTVGGVGTGAVLTPVVTGGKITSITVTNGGTGYKATNTPLLIKYTKALKFSIIGSQTASTGMGDFSPMWPFIARTATAQSNASIHIGSDIAYAAGSVADATFKKISGNNFFHALEWTNISGAREVRIYQPPQV